MSVCILYLFALYCFIVDRELEVTWATMEFEYIPHDRTGIKMPRASEEVVETLEDNQVASRSLPGKNPFNFYQFLTSAQIFRLFSVSINSSPKRIICS